MIDQRVIDRDVCFYTADVEHRLFKLRVSPPALESQRKEMLDAAEKVLAALNDYRNVIDKCGFLNV